jgi:hypothetical protein
MSELTYGWMRAALGYWTEGVVRSRWSPWSSKRIWYRREKKESGIIYCERYRYCYVHKP